MQKIVSQIDQISSGNNSQILNALLENQNRLKGLLLDSQTQNTNSKLDEITSKIDQVATRIDVAILVISTQKGLTWWARKVARRAQYFGVKKFIAYINDDGWIDENELESAITDFFYYRDLNFQIVHDIDELVYELDNL